MSDQSDVRPSLEYDSFVVLVRFEGTVEKYTLVAFPSVLEKTNLHPGYALHYETDSTRTYLSA